jgi:hypothetical protein
MPSGRRAVLQTLRRLLLRRMMCTPCLAEMLFCLELPAVCKLLDWHPARQQLSGAGQHLSRGHRSDRELGFRRPPHRHWSGPRTSDMEDYGTIPISKREPLAFTYDQWGYRQAMQVRQAD